MNRSVIIITGPTCTGKSETSIRLARLLDGEIVNADSVQVYKGMDIGSAKMDQSQMCGVKHHLIDILEPGERFSVSDFVISAHKSIMDILERGKTPIVVGGTGFYIDSLLFGSFDEHDGTDPLIREGLRERLSQEGHESLYKELEEKDPVYASTVHMNNSYRLIRALEYIAVTGKRYSEHVSKRNSSPEFDFRCFVFDDKRDELYHRIDKRVDDMIASGFEDEVRGLLKRTSSSSVAMQSIGYKQMCTYLFGDMTLEDTIKTIKTATRHLAKRQLTWFRHVEYAEWIDISEFSRDPEKIAGHIAQMLKTNV